MTSPWESQPWYSGVLNIFGDVPEMVWGPILGVESNGNPRALGDFQNGQPKSFGLFQIYTAGGLGDRFANNPTALFDPTLNAQIAADAMKPAYREATSKGLSGYDLVEYVASHSGFPLMNGNMPESYRSKLQDRYNVYASSGTGLLSSAVSFESGQPVLLETLRQIDRIEQTPFALKAEVIPKVSLMVAFGIAALGLIIVGLISFVGVGSAVEIANNLSLPKEEE